MKKAITMIIFLFCLTLFYSCSSQNGVSQSSNISSSNSVSTPKSTATSSFQVDQYFKPQIVLTENICQIGQSVTTVDFNDKPDFTYVINSIKSSKHLGDYNKDYFTYFGNEGADDNGNLTGNKSYLFINFTIRNEVDKPANLYMNVFPVVHTDENNVVISMASEVKFLDKPQHPGNRKSFFSYNLKPKEEKTITIGYTATDDFIKNDKIYFVVGKLGSRDFDKSNKFIKIDPIPGE